MALLAGFPSATVVMEACVRAHFMARRIAAFGHNTQVDLFAMGSLLRIRKTQRKRLC
jgi:hypothetical protein